MKRINVIALALFAVLSLINLGAVTGKGMVQAIAKKEPAKQKLLTETAKKPPRNLAIGRLQHADACSRGIEVGG